MRSPYLCACGCGDNVATGGAYVPGHERPSVARKYREQKAANIQAIRDAKAARTKLPPHFSRGAEPVQAEHPRPDRSKHFGRGGMNGIV